MIKRATVKFLYVIICMVMISCGPTVIIDYEESVNFEDYSTYNFYPDIQSGLNELDDERIKTSLDSLLGARGFTKSSTPNMLINFFARESISNSRNTIGIGIGGGGRNVGVGVSGGIPIGGAVINQQLTVDFIDADADSLIWQAVAEGRLSEKSNPDQRKKYYTVLISRILQKYPPKK